MYYNILSINNITTTYCDDNIHCASRATQNTPTTTSLLQYKYNKYPRVQIQGESEKQQIWDLGCAALSAEANLPTVVGQHIRENDFAESLQYLVQVLLYYSVQ